MNIALLIVLSFGLLPNLSHSQSQSTSALVDVQLLSDQFISKDFTNNLLLVLEQKNHLQRMQTLNISAKEKTELATQAEKFFISQRLKTFFKMQFSLSEKLAAHVRRHTQGHMPGANKRQAFSLEFQSGELSSLCSISYTIGNTYAYYCSSIQFFVKTATGSLKEIAVLTVYPVNSLNPRYSPDFPALAPKEILTDVKFNLKFFQ